MRNEKRNLEYCNCIVVILLTYSCSLSCFHRGLLGWMRFDRRGRKKKIRVNERALREDDVEMEVCIWTEITSRINQRRKRV